MHKPLSEHELRIENERLMREYHLMLARMERIASYARSITTEANPVLRQSIVDAILRETRKAGVPDGASR